MLVKIFCDIASKVPAKLSHTAAREPFSQKAKRRGVPSLLTSPHFHYTHTGGLNDGLFAFSFDTFQT
jgi:hypothetical protein